MTAAVPPTAMARLEAVDPARLRHAHRHARAPARALRRAHGDASASGPRSRATSISSIYADREHSANLAYLTGFDPRFEEAVLIVGPDGDPAILVGNECWGMAGAAPLPMRRHRFQDLSLPGQPRDRSAPLAEILARRASGRAAASASSAGRRMPSRDMSDVPAYLVDDAARRPPGATGSVENATDLFIDAADGLRVVNEVEQLAAFEWAALPDLARRAALLARTAAGHDRARGGGAARLERLAAVLPSDADRRPARRVRPAQPGRPADRARRPVHHGLRDLGRADLPGRLRGRGRRRAARRRSTTTSSGWWARTSPRSPSGTGRCASARRAVRSKTIIARRLGDPFFGIFLNPGHQIHLDEWVNSPISPGSTIELRSGMALQVDIIPATGTDVLHDQHRGRDRPGRRHAAGRARAALSRPVAASSAGAASWRPRSASICIPTSSRSRTSRRAAALPAAAGPRDDDRRMTGLREIVLRSEEMEVVILPTSGDESTGSERSARTSCGHLMTRPCTSPNRSSGVPMSCRRGAIERRRGRPCRGREVALAANFPDGTAIHGLVSSARWLERSSGELACAGGGDGWPWAFEVSQTASLNGATLTLEYQSGNLDDAPMPAGIGLHPWFRRPVEVRLPAEAVYWMNPDSAPHPRR